MTSSAAKEVWAAGIGIERRDAHQTVNAISLLKSHRRFSPSMQMAAAEARRLAVLIVQNLIFKIMAFRPGCNIR